MEKISKNDFQTVSFKEIACSRFFPFKFFNQYTTVIAFNVTKMIDLLKI